MRDLTSKAEEAAATHTGEIRQALDKTEAALDQQTDGKHHDKIEQADAYLEGSRPGRRETVSRTI